MILKFRTITLIFVLLASLASASDVKFYNINDLHRISVREANSVIQDNTGFIWVSSKTGILRLTGDAYKTYQLPYETANIITIKLLYERSQLLAFTNNGQVFKYNDVFDRFDLIINLNRELNSNYLSLNSILTDENNVYWFFTSTGLFILEDGKLSLINNYPSLIHKALWIDNSQIIFTNNYEIILFDTKSHSGEILHKSPFYFEASEIYFDRQLNRLWVGTISNGLYYYDFNSGKYLKSLISNLPNQPILAIESISGSTLMIGIDGQGLWELDRTGTKVLNVYKENNDNPLSLRGNGVYDIFCDCKKRVWICTYSGGISYFDISSPGVTQYTHLPNNTNSLINNDVNCVIEDQSGKIWFATNNGISCWNVSENKWNSFYVNKQEQAQVFLTLCEDKEGRIWAGSYSSGVYILDGQTGRQLAHYSQIEESSPFINDFVFDIIKDSNGDIWIGGINKEVVRYKFSDNSFRKYSIQPINVLSDFNGENMLFGCTYGLILSDNETGSVTPLLNGLLIHDILVQDSIIWLGTSGEGLIRYNHLTDRSEKFKIQEGLPSNFVNSVAYSDGYLWLGTENGLCRFDPERKSALVFSSIYSLSSVSFNRNSHFKLKNGQLVWGTNNGAVIFNPNTLHEFNTSGKIFLQDLSISGRSIRDISSFKLNTPLDSLESLKLKYNQNTLTFELIPIGVASGSKLSWKMEGLDKDWSQPTSNRILSFSNIRNKNYILKLRLYDNSLSQILAERDIKIRITPPFWVQWWFLIIIFLIASSVIYFIFWNYINRLKQEHTEEKVRFFTNTAHDIRTSLTLIKAPVEELTKESNLSQKGRHYLKLATEQVGRLSSVVTQLMEFQKADIGKSRLSLKMVELVDFMRYRIQMFESLAGTKNVRLQFSSNIPKYITAVDETMLEKILDNLVSNAIKYSLSDSNVDVNLNCSNLSWSLSVIDCGIGISHKAQKQLFKEFYRGENAINSKIVGSGIGLLMVKNYVELHEGKITFTSKENEGSQFEITIPFKEVETKSPRNISQLIAETVVPVPHNNNIENTEEDSGTSPKEMRILLVEDNDDLLDFLKLSLSDEFEVLTANDGALAWELIQNQYPDLVVSDVMMPNMDGFELCKIIKSTSETSHIPFVLLTALTEKAQQLHGLGLGADDYLTKPFDVTLLQQKIKTIILNRETVRNNALKLTKENINVTILGNELNDKFLKNMLDVVRNNIANTEFGKDEFAMEMNVSPSLLYKKIKSLTGQSPVDFIKTVRMEYALELIQGRKYTVTEVSDLCGFSTASYFSTVFKKHFGKSPTEILE